MFGAENLDPASIHAQQVIVSEIFRRPAREETCDAGRPCASHHVQVCGGGKSPHTRPRAEGACRSAVSEFRPIAMIFRSTMPPLPSMESVPPPG